MVQTRYLLLLLVLTSCKDAPLDRAATSYAECTTANAAIFSSLVGVWEVEWTYRVEVGKYETSTASAVIEPALLGCALIEKFEGTLRGKDFSRVTMVGIDDDNLLTQIGIDSEHRRFGETAGTISGDSLIFEFSRDMGERILRRREHFAVSDSGRINMRAELSVSEESPWALVEEAIYRRVTD